MLGRFAAGSGQDPLELLDQSKLATVQASVVLLVTGMVLEGLLGQRDVGYLFAWAALALAGTPILVSALRGLAEGHAHMDELVAIAIVAALGAGYILDVPKVMEAAEIAVIMQIGSLIEEWASSASHRSVKSLESLIPRTVRVQNGSETVERDVDDLRPGDLLSVRPGDRVGADGRIVAGESSFNQAAITGESLPVERGPGDEVFAGSINQGNAVTVRVEHVRGDSAIGRVIRMIRQGEAYQPDIIRAADKFFVYYTPAVLILAAATLMLVMGPTKPERNDAIERAVSMLVVGCPCPLLLASPLAIMCGLSRAARAGIAIKAGKFLEAIRQVRTVVFDKTGTVTTGNIKVVGVDTVPGFEGGEARLMTLAAAAEVKSNHPLAQAVLREAKARNLPAAEPASFEQVGGLGVKAEHDGRKLVVGSRKLMEKELGAEAFAAQSAALTGGLDDGRLHVFVAVDGKLSGLLRMEDTIRDDAAETVARLKEMGIERIVLLTGDRKAVAERVGAAVGITEVRADLLPEQKIAFIRELQAEGLKVAMVGDGVNDAPALGAADVGIAVGDTATDVALEVANASILSGHLRQLPFFLDVSRATVSTVHWNLGIACGFNAIALLASGAGLFAAAVAAVVHVIATLVIILNSLSLNRRSERPAGEDADSDANAYGGGPAVEAASMRFLRREPATPAASVPATARP